MRSAINRRLAALEQRKSHGGRRMHVVKATDDADSKRQMADLLATRTIGRADGFLCITGKPNLN